MQLQLRRDVTDSYKSASQRIRVASETWAEGNLFCANCESPDLSRTAANTPALDLTCPNCASRFELKAQSRPFTERIVDAAYSKMRRAIEDDRTPNLLALEYSAEKWKVQNLILIPRYALTLSVLEKRKPLAATARRAGWVGCNILIGAIPPDARIAVVVEGVPQNPRAVRRSFRRVRQLEKLDPLKRGWTLDVLNIVRQFGKPEFNLPDVYASEEKLHRLHPSNRHVRDKIRQQLQILRDLGFLRFLGNGRYRLR